MRDAHMYTWLVLVAQAELCSNIIFLHWDIISEGSVYLKNNNNIYIYIYIYINYFRQKIE